MSHTPVEGALFELTDLTPAKPEPVYAVHCFFNCPHVVRESHPDTASAAMEQHYNEIHTADIDRALGLIGVQPATRHRKAAACHAKPAAAPTEEPSL